MNLGLALVGAMASCADNTWGSGDGGESDSGLEIGSEHICDTTTIDFGPFAVESVARGIDLDVGDVEGHPGGNVADTLVAEDLDADGDIDLAFPSFTGDPILYANDGSGHFTKHATALDSDWVANHGVADLDGDGLPDLIVVGIGRVDVAWNLGKMEFSTAETLLNLDIPAPIFSTFTAVDIDLDGDLYLAVIGAGLITDPCQIGGGCPASGLGTDVYVLVNDGHTFTLAETLNPAGVSGFSLAGTFTDRDGDRDPDLLVSSDFAEAADRTQVPPNAFYRNDGVGSDGQVNWVNDAPTLGIDVVMSGMGFSTGDYNEDGALDYCISDIGRLRCFLTDAGGYYDAGRAMGLYPANAESDGWSAWSMDILDLNNDGLLDAFASGGRAADDELAGDVLQPDLLFRGDGPGVLTDVTTDFAFGSSLDDYGAAAADFDDDGFLEIVITPSVGRPQFYHSPCGGGAWTAVDLVGPPGNRAGIGARIDVGAGGRIQSQEFQTLRGPGQSPSMAWFGLGSDATLDSLTIMWPGGDQQQFTNIQARRRLTVVHPDALP